MGEPLKTVVSVEGVLDPSLKKSMAEAEKAMEGVDVKAVAVATSIAASFAAIGAAIVGAGAYLYSLGSEFDAAADNIRIGTGATGEALDALNESFDNVYKSVPAELEKVSQAIADYNTRLGLTGPELEGISKQALLLSENLGAGELGAVIEGSSKAFQQWKVSSEDMGGAMDYIFKVSQSTGMGFNDLMSKLQSYGPQLQELGFSFEEAAALMGQLDKAGVNTDEVLGALKKSIGVMAEEGISAKDGLNAYVGAIQNAGDAAEATAIASEVFGKKAGSTMAAAIRNGSLSVEDLTNELLNNGETIQGVSDDTFDFAEKWAMLQHELQLALKPLAGTVFDSLSLLIPPLSEAFTKLSPLIPAITAEIVPLAEYLADGITAMGDLASFVIDNWDLIVPIVLGVTGAWGTYTIASKLAALATGGQAVAITGANIATGAWNLIASVGTAITSGFGAAMAFLTSPIGLVVLAVGAAIAIGVLLYKNWDTVCEYATILGDTISGAWDSISSATLAMGQSIIDGFSMAFNSLVDICKAPLNAVIAIINTAIDGINQIGFTVPDWVPLIGGNAFSVDLPQLPFLAAGGFTDGISIAGEAGTEAVISFDPAYRNENLSYWAKAGRMLGLSDDTGILSDLSSGGNGMVVYQLGGLSFSPQVVVQGNNLNGKDVMKEIKSSEPEFMDMVEKWFTERGAARYDADGII